MATGIATFCLLNGQERLSRHCVAAASGQNGEILVHRRASLLVIGEGYGVGLAAAVAASPFASAVTIDANVSEPVKG